MYLNMCVSMPLFFSGEAFFPDTTTHLHTLHRSRGRLSSSGRRDDQQRTRIWAGFGSVHTGGRISNSHARCSERAAYIHTCQICKKSRQHGGRGQAEGVPPKPRRTPLARPSQRQSADRGAVTDGAVRLPQRHGHKAHARNDAGDGLCARRRRRVSARRTAPVASTAAPDRARERAQVFGDDPTVQKLEETTAALLGKESGLFVTTGTLSNQLAMRVHVGPLDEVLCDHRAHIHVWEVRRQRGHGRAEHGGRPPTRSPRARVRRHGRWAASISRAQLLPLWCLPTVRAFSPRRTLRRARARTTACTTSRSRGCSRSRTRSTAPSCPSSR
jgi:hypothetical protein